MARRNRNVNRFAQRKRDQREKAKNPQAQPAPDVRKHYDDIVRENEAFEQYYKMQEVCPKEEYDKFMHSLKQNLPTAFRITGSKCEAEALMKIVQSEYFAELLNVKLKTEEGEEEQEIKPMSLPWYPGGLAWQLRLSRTDIRRNELLYRLHNFLVAETAAGGVSRQEAVSMIPPVLLDVKPHHKVLDMCAAPGSKTAQLIEFLHAEEDKMPTGFVMANDVDNSRCYMLVHQAKRLNSPCILITNHDSAVLPALVITDDQDPTKTKPLKFDRVLCDVPCSGDATLRKNPDIWTKWSPGNGNNLHGIQYRILRRGLELLSPGGRLVYSTCSFNPVENEAVVRRALADAEGSTVLVDAHAEIPALKCAKGMTYWKPASKDLVSYESYAEVPEKWQTVVRPQMFPPAKDELDKYHLERCIRVLPHHQDTGGFFVAVFEKLSPMPWEKQDKPEDKELTKENNIEEKKEPPRKKRRMGGYKEDPFVFFSGEEEDVYPSIKEFYDLKDFDAKCLLTRCHVGKKKNIYLVSPAVKDIVEKNESKVKIINTGVKTFVRCDNKNMSCAFRLSQEGLPSIKSFIGEKRRLNILKEDLILVLQNDNPSQPPDIKLFSEHTRNQVKDFATGSCVLDYAGDAGLRLSLVGWRGVHSLRAYTAAPDTVHHLRLLGADYSKYDINKFKKASDVPNGAGEASRDESQIVADESELETSTAANDAQDGDEVMDATETTGDS